jgi:general secretion pathway protein M
MSGGFSFWWRERSRREQLLLMVMAGLAALVIAWFLVVRPLSDRLDAAKTRYAAAAVMLGEARAREAQARAGARGPAVALPIDSLVAGTAAQAGFPSARVTPQGPAQASAAIDAARPQALFAWVLRLEQSGLAVERLRAQANSDRTLAAEIGFRARGR